MKELLEELKALIAADKKEEAVAKVDELQKVIEDNNISVPLPGEGSNGKPIK